MSGMPRPPLGDRAYYFLLPWVWIVGAFLGLSILAGAAALTWELVLR